MGILRVCGGWLVFDKWKGSGAPPEWFFAFLSLAPSIDQTRADTHAHTHTRRMQPYIHLNLL